MWERKAKSIPGSGIEHSGTLDPRIVRESRKLKDKLESLTPVGEVRVICVIPRLLPYLTEVFAVGT